MFGAGILVGWWFALRPTRVMIGDFYRDWTLGLNARDDRRAQYAQAFYDPNEALAGMDDYLWEVPSVPTPFVGHAPRPGDHANGTINAQQLRHPEDLAIPKPEGVFRIFLTGGSTAFSSGAPDENRTISAYLSALFEGDGEGERRGGADRGRVEVVTAAMPGWSSTHERIWIVHHLSRLEPDLIVALSGANDGHWGGMGRDVFWMRSYADEHYWNLLAFLYRGAGEALPDVAMAPGERVPPDVVARRLLRNVDQTTHFLSRRGVAFVFALQPTLPATGKPMSEREAAHARSRRDYYGPGTFEYLAACHERIRSSLFGADFPDYVFLDLSIVFDAAKARDEIFLDMFHFGDRGNEILALALYEGLAPVVRDAR